MINLISASLFFLAAGYLTSVSILSAYQVLIAIPLFWATWLAVKNKDYSLPKSSWWLLAFTVVALLGLVINFDIVPKPGKNFGRLKYFLMGVTSIWVMKFWLKNSTDKARKIILNTFFLSMSIAGAYACYTYFFLGNQRAEVLTEKMRYGYGSGMILLVLLSMILHHKRFQGILDLRTAIPAFVIGFLGMYLTYTRGALLGFLCGFPVLLFFYQKRLAYILGGLAVVVILTLSGFYFFGTGNYESRLLQKRDNYSDNVRMSQWQSAIVAIKEKPILGWGLSNFHTQVKRIKEEHNFEAKNYNDAHAHNLFLEIAAGTGLIGLFIFLGWVFSWAWECWKAGDLVRALIIPYGIAFVISSQFEVTFDANNASVIMFVYAISEAAILLSKRSE